jgi:SAM-dependent methyltransferase
MNTGITLTQAAADSSSIRVPVCFRDAIRCPICRSAVELQEHQAKCQNCDCAQVFSVHTGVPILLKPGGSLFDAADVVGNNSNAKQNIPPGRLNTWKRFLPTLDSNIKAERNVTVLVQTLSKRSASGAPIRVLIVGGRVLGQAMDHLNSLSPRFEVLHTDVALGPQTEMVCDAHDLPFSDGSFDCIVAQAVLEHVRDPWQCVAEMHRVLRPRGVVYAETPFMQQGHMGAYDFTRFTHLGHRNLFSRFAEIDSGPLCGPGMALAWAYQYFLCSFARSRRSRRVFSVVARFSAFFLKYFDYWLIDTPGAFDAASAFYFLGERDEQPLSGRALLGHYRGFND